MFANGTRVFVQHLTGPAGVKFGKCDTNDRGVVVSSFRTFKVKGVTEMVASLAVVWDTGEADDLTDSGYSTDHPFRVLAVRNLSHADKVRIAEVLASEYENLYNTAKQRIGA